MGEARSSASAQHTVDASFAAALAKIDAEEAAAAIRRREAASPASIAAHASPSALRSLRFGGAGDSVPSPGRAYLESVTAAEQRERAALNEARFSDVALATTPPGEAPAALRLVAGDLREEREHRGLAASPHAEADAVSPPPLPDEDDSPGARLLAYARAFFYYSDPPLLDASTGEETFPTVSDENAPRAGFQASAEASSRPRACCFVSPCTASLTRCPPDWA